MLILISWYKSQCRCTTEPNPCHHHPMKSFNVKCNETSLSSLPNSLPEVYSTACKCIWIFRSACGLKNADSYQQWSQQQPAGVCSWRPAGINTLCTSYSWLHLESKSAKDVIINSCQLAYPPDKYKWHQLFKMILGANCSHAATAWSDQ